ILSKGSKGMKTVRFVIRRIEIDAIPATRKDNLHPQIVWAIFVGYVSRGCTGLRVIDTCPGYSSTFQGSLFASIKWASSHHLESLWNGDKRMCSCSRRNGWYIRDAPSLPPLEHFPPSRQ